MKFIGILTLTLIYSRFGRSEYMNWRMHLSKGPKHAKLSSALQSYVKHILHCWELLHSYSSPALFSSREKKARERAQKCIFKRINNFFVRMVHAEQRWRQRSLIPAQIHWSLLRHNSNCDPLMWQNARQFPIKTWGGWTVFSRPVLQYRKTKKVVF